MDSVFKTINSKTKTGQDDGRLLRHALPALGAVGRFPRHRRHAGLVRYAVFVYVLVRYRRRQRRLVGCQPSRSIVLQMMDFV